MPIQRVIVALAILAACYFMTMMYIIEHYTTFEGIKNYILNDIHILQNDFNESADYLKEGPHKQVRRRIFYWDNTSAAKYPKWNVEWPHSYYPKTPNNDLLHMIHQYQHLVSPPVFNASHRIPRIVHQMWKTKYLPSQMVAWVSKWRVTHPDWMYIFWTDVSARKFVAQRFKPLLKTYDDFQHGVLKADMFRYMVLYTFGGVYADLDVEPLKNLDPIRDWAPCIMSQEPNVHHQVSNYLSYGSKAELNYTLACNAFMACRPGHPFFFYLLSRIVEVSVAVTSRKCGLQLTLACTGPEMMTKALTFYRRSMSKRTRDQHPEDDVILAEPETFLPTFDEGQIERMKHRCRRRNKLSPLGRRICVQLKARNFANNNVTKQSYTNHHWFHTYHRPAHSMARKMVHIGDVMPDVWFLRS